MNNPRAKTLSKGTRLRLFIAAASVVAIAAIMPGVAAAGIFPTTTTNYELNTPGAHGFYEVTMNYQYGASAPGAAEPAAGAEDLKKWIIDSPAGLYGNPNAVPFADRCTPAQFEPVTGPMGVFTNSTCPASSKVGDATVTVALDNGSPGGQLNGEIFILQTTPEVPTTLATRFFSVDNQNGTGACGAPPCPLYPKTKSVIAPVTSGPDGDFRLRTIPAEYNTRPTVYPAGPAPPAIPAHIIAIRQRLYGNAANGNPFITYPTRCSDWNTTAYAHAYDTPTGTVSGIDPNHTSDLYEQSNTNVVTPSCTNLPGFQASLTASINTPDRSQNPQLDVVLNNPGGTSGDVPKDVVVKLPGSIAADIDGIQPSKLCTIAQRDANACPAASKVGTVTVATPLISAGLTGDVHLIAKTEGGLPNLAFFVTGAISFRLDATTAYVGAKGTEIETTLSNLPQVPFTQFALRVNGGAADSLLVYRECPTDGSGPQDGPITNRLTGYTGAVVTGSSPVDSNGCYGTPRVSSFRKCVKYKLKFTPRNLINTGNMMKIEVWVKGRFGKAKRVKVYKKSPYKMSVPLTTRRFTSGRSYKYKVRVVYKPTIDAPKGKVLNSRYAKFKKC